MKSRRLGTTYKALLLVLGLLFCLGAKLLSQELALEDRGVFFEQPQALVSQQAWFPEARSGGDVITVVYQEVQQEGDAGGTIHLSVLSSDSGRDWERYGRVIGPLSYDSSKPPVVFSSRVAEDGTIYIAYLDGATETVIVRSTDRGRSFSEVARLETDITSVAPTLSLREDGGLLLFVNQNRQGLQRILYTYSDDGETWSSFSPLAEEMEIGLHFLPSHASLNGREYVVFQSLNPDQATTYQLYSKYSDDGGQTWSEAQLITEFADQPESDDYLDYDNQRPFLRRLDDTLALVWERALGTQATQAYYSTLSADATRSGEPTAASDATVGATAPHVFSFQGTTYVLWFSDPSGRARIVLAAKTNGSWVRTTLSGPNRRATFGSPLVHEGKMHLFWQREPGDPASNQLVYLEPDQSAQPPSPEPVNYVRGRRSSNRVAEYRWERPEDASGISGYSYVWSRDPDAEVPKELAVSSTRNAVELEAPEDGEWFFRIRARDRAGNWSEPASVSFVKDTTPPNEVDFAAPPVDENGYLVSNTFSLGWNPPDAPDVAGYTTSLTRVGDARSSIPDEYEPGNLPSTVVTESSSISRNNFDNGLWALSVAPVDTVGNVGPAETLFVRLNKYVPLTEIYRIAVERDRLGRYAMNLRGRGFTANGTINRIVLDRDGQSPYEYVFQRDAGDYRVVDNNTIAGLTVEDIDTGTYRLGVNHTERGLHFAGRSLSFEESGRITFGDYTVRYAPEYTTELPGLFTIAASDMLIWTVLAMVILVMVFSTTRITGVVREGRLLQLEARALVYSERLPLEDKKRRAEAMRRRGIGLRVKFTFFAVLLVISVVAALAFFLSRTALERQENILARGLEQRVELLLDSVTAQSEDLLINPQNSRVELSNLVDQEGVLDEALYITITGKGRGTSQYGYVWATNDPALAGAGQQAGQQAAQQADGQQAPEDAQQEGRRRQPDRREEIAREGLDRSLSTPSFVAGESQLTDPVSDVAVELQERLGQEAREALGDIPSQIEEINNEIVRLITEEGLSEDSPQISRLDSTRTELESRLSEILDDIGATFRSVPEFEAETVTSERTRYIFYQPVMAWDPGSSAETQQYYRGMVRIGVSNELILEEIATAQRELVISTIIVALVAVGAGAVGALLLATIVVIPINRLVRGVEVIRDTEDKEKLREHAINVRTRDELSVLANTVNSMTQGLVAAAATNKELTVGKEVQKMFIPLETDNDSRKMTTVNEDAGGVEFAGYYEGASAVSGDYFTYTRLDDRYYAIIKCDVSGHGVSAALIMVQVATLYTYFFRDWESNKKISQALSNLVIQINDIIESMSFSGRFAAFTLALLDTHTGEMRICTAGDKLLDVLSGKTGRLRQVMFKETPAAGVFPSDLVEMRGGFPEDRITLEAGDTALLYTDGIEESFHMLRNSDYSLHTVTAEDREQGRVPTEESDDPRAQNPVDEGQQREDFGTWRIYGIIEALQRQERFELNRLFDPDGVDLVFDFSECEPTNENIVLAVMSVEKVFRLYRHPQAGADDRVRVDTKIDDFLKKYFLQYNSYFHHPLETTDLPEYRYFSHIREDEQEDDLTILAIRKK